MRILSSHHSEPSLDTRSFGHCQDNLPESFEDSEPELEKTPMIRKEKEEEVPREIQSEHLYYKRGSSVHPSDPSRYRVRSLEELRNIILDSEKIPSLIPRSF